LISNIIKLIKHYQKIFFLIKKSLYKKLEKELHEKRKQMANIIEQANTAYEERDKANDLIASLKQIAKRESTDFEKELRDLS